MATLRSWSSKNRLWWWITRFPRVKEIEKASLSCCFTKITRRSLLCRILLNLWGRRFRSWRGRLAFWVSRRSTLRNNGYIFWEKCSAKVIIWGRESFLFYKKWWLFPMFPKCQTCRTVSTRFLRTVCFRNTSCFDQRSPNNLQREWRLSQNLGRLDWPRRIWCVTFTNRRNSWCLCWWSSHNGNPSWCFLR